MFVVLKFCGAAYLIWLGIKKWRYAGHMLSANEKANRANVMVEIGLGLAMTLSNPIAIVFYMALLPGVIDISGLTLNTYAVLCFIIIGVMTCVVFGYGIMAKLVRACSQYNRRQAHDWSTDFAARGDQCLAGHTK